MAKKPNQSSGNETPDPDSRDRAPYKDLPNSRFQKGHERYALGGARPGSGRKCSEVKELERKLKNNAGDIRKTWLKMVELAHAGNVEAIKLHIERVFGKIPAATMTTEESENAIRKVTIIVN